MPRKGKRGSKGKKGVNKESAQALAAASSKIWEAKLDIANLSKKEFQERANKLMVENDILHAQMFQSERDTIDIITYLSKQDEDKDGQLERQLQKMREFQEHHNKEKENIIENFSKQLNELELRLAEKNKEIELIHYELKLVKEFRQQRGQMQRQLEDIKEAFQKANADHRLTLERMEQKFFEEKMHLQQEASKKIAELAGKAHTEAITNLDETTKSVYKENVRLTQSLDYHMKERDALKKERDRLLEENANLRQEKEVTDIMVQSKVGQCNHQRETIKEMTEKIRILEKSLSDVVKEFETEGEIIHREETENASANAEIIKLQRVIEMKTREMNKVKRLAKNILDERTELEHFFLSSLDDVKAEIADNRAQYRKEASAAYHQKMLAAHSCKDEYPKIRTFTTKEESTNSVHHDMEAANMLYNVRGKVHISDLTWEQKERVLRYLFARINMHRSKPSLPYIDEKHNQTFSITQGEDRADTEFGDQTFLTQPQPNAALNSIVPAETTEMIN
ncbi:hypothetical protein BsWGS_10582 [Bradybaena similaris]